MKKGLVLLCAIAMVLSACTGSVVEEDPYDTTNYNYRLDSGGVKYFVDSYHVIYGAISIDSPYLEMTTTESEGIVFTSLVVRDARLYLAPPVLIVNLREK